MTYNPIKKYEYRAESNQNYSQPQYAAIIPVLPNGVIDKNNQYGPWGGVGPGKFLINPSSWEENKSANWTISNTIGQSDPVLQWINSGPRVVNFEALVTKDTIYYGKEVLQTNSNGPSSANPTSLLANIANSFFKVANITPSVGNLSQQNVNLVPGYLDISPYLEYYRSLLYPTYDPTSVKLLASPPLVVLYAGSSLSRIPYGAKISANTDVWVLTSLRIKISKQLPNLAPMEAEIQFQLTQYNINSYSRTRFTLESNKGIGSNYYE
jgi:hypothetical protein